MDNPNPSAEKSSKELRDEKSRDLKLEEQVLKQLGPATTIEEKFNILLKKFIETEKTCKKLNSTIKLSEKKFDLLSREKDILQKEYNKGVLMKDKLEQVCREQQKLIKSVKNESLTKIREEEEKRRENQAKFQDSINEISITLNKNNEENMKLKEDNIEMTKKLKCLAEQYQTREKQVQKISEQIQLEYQLHEAKLAKIQMEAAIEKETLLRDKQSALDELLNCKKIIQEMQNREEYLKEQLQLYTSKYDDFQNSLQKSNDIFSTYKIELEKMYKNSRKLEKECLEWKKKWEKSNASLIQLATENQEKDEHLTKLTRQLSQLQKLLRALQAERNCLYQVLKDNNIERPAIPVLPEEPEITLPSSNAVKSADKMEQMAKNCAELKQTLSKLQNQVEAITNKPQSSSSAATTETTSDNANKKGKSNKKSRTKGNKGNSAKENSKNQIISITEQSATTSTDQLLETTEKIALSNNLENSVNLLPNSSNTETKLDTIIINEENVENSNTKTQEEVVSMLTSQESSQEQKQNSNLNDEVNLNIEVEKICENSIENNDSGKSQINIELNENQNVSVNLQLQNDVTTKDTISEIQETSQIAEDFNLKCEINEKLSDDGDKSLTVNSNNLT